MRSESLPLLPPPEEAQSNENPLRTSTGIVTLLGCSMTMFCVNCIVSIVAPFFPQYAEKENGASQTIIGMIFAVYPLGVFLSSFFWAKTCKKIGKKMVLGLGLFILSLSTIGFGLCKEIYLYFIVRFIQGVGASAAGTASSVILMEAFPDNLGAVVGIMEMLTGLGFIFGPPIGGLLYGNDTKNFKIPFLVMGTLPLSVLFALPFFKVVSVDAQKDATSTENFRLPSMFNLFFSTVSLGVALGTCALGFVEPVLADHFLHDLNLNLSPAQVGLVFIIPGGLYVLFSPVCGFLGDKIGHIPVLISGYFVLAASYILIGPTPFLQIPTDNTSVNWATQIISMILLGIGCAFGLIPTLPLMQESTKHLGPDAILYSASLFNSFLSIGEGSGPFLGGVLVNKLGFRYGSFVFGAVLLAYGALLLILWLSGCFSVVQLDEEEAEFVEPLVEHPPLVKRSTIMRSVSRDASFLGYRASLN